MDVTRTLRKDSNVPILILTARSEETDKLIGLELVRMITSPSRLAQELVARVPGDFPPDGSLQ